MDKINNFLTNMQRILVLIRFDIHNKNNLEYINDLITYLSQDDKNVIFTKEAKEFTLNALKIIKEALETENYDLAYDVVDMLHVFPDVIMCREKKSLMNYHKTYVKPMLKKWDLKLK